MTRRTGHEETIQLVVSFVRPKGATIEEMIAYVDDAVSTWTGQCRPPCALSDDDPGDPMFGLDQNTVKVRRLK